MIARSLDGAIGCHARWHCARRLVVDRHVEHPLRGGHPGEVAVLVIDDPDGGVLPVILTASDPEAVVEGCATIAGDRREIRVAAPDFAVAGLANPVSEVDGDCATHDRVGPDS